LSTTPRSRRAAPPPPAAPRSSPAQCELLAAPELAVLVALQQLLELTTLTLAAIHPELIGDRSCLRPLDSQDTMARRVSHPARRGIALDKAGPPSTLSAPGARFTHCYRKHTHVRCRHERSGPRCIRAGGDRAGGIMFAIMQRPMRSISL
jgi:hypothetical protein